MESGNGSHARDVIFIVVFRPVKQGRGWGGTKTSIAYIIASFGSRVLVFIL